MISQVADRLDDSVGLGGTGGVKSCRCVGVSAIANTVRGNRTHLTTNAPHTNDSPLGLDRTHRCVRLRIFLPQGQIITDHHPPIERIDPCVNHSDYGGEEIYSKHSISKHSMQEQHFASSLANQSLSVVAEHVLGVPPSRGAALGAFTGTDANRRPLPPGYQVVAAASSVSKTRRCPQLGAHRRLNRPDRRELGSQLNEANCLVLVISIGVEITSAPSRKAASKPVIYAAANPRFRPWDTT